MPWKLCRITANLTPDGAWHGLERRSASAPPSDRPGVDDGASIFFPIESGVGGAQLFGEDEVLIRVAWCTAQGVPLVGQGTTCTIQPVTLDSLPMPLRPAQLVEQLHVGSSLENACRQPLYMRVGPAGRASVRFDAMDATGATGGTPARAAVWYWAR